MAQIVAEEELYRSCHILFGKDLKVSQDFLQYIQLSGIKKAYRKKALEIHEQAIVIDTHCDVPMGMYYRDFDITIRNERGHFDLERMREGGLDAEFLIVWVPNSLDEKHPSKQALEILKDGAGTQFDPRIVEVLEEAKQEVLEIYEGS